MNYKEDNFIEELFRNHRMYILNDIILLKLDENLH